MTFKLGKKSLLKLEGLHPDLQAVVKRAIEVSEVDFTVGEGVRTLETQKKYVRIGASKTMRSRHIPASNKCNLGCAVDLWALNDVDGDGDLDINWVEKHYKPIAEAMKKAANELNIPIEWGADLWGWDSPHFQLPWGSYP
jgi:peptidoglycan L-alanyl-D-glutamate endopeptidase CwlK